MAVTAPGRRCRRPRRRARPSRRRNATASPRASSTCRGTGRRVAEAAEAHVDDPRAVGDRPADRLRLGLDGDRALRADDLRDEELRRGRQAGDTDSVVRRAPRSARRRTCRGPACRPWRSRRRSSSRPRSGRAARDASRRCPSRSRRRARRRGAAARPTSRTSGSARHTTAAAGMGRRARTRRAGRRAARRSAFPRRRGGRRRRGAETASARIGARSVDPRRPAGAELLGDGGRVGGTARRRPQSAPRARPARPRGTTTTAARRADALELTSAVPPER